MSKHAPARPTDPASAGGTGSAQGRDPERSAERFALLAGSLLAALGVGLGAFGAHGLRNVLDAGALAWWQTAVQYQMWHAIGLLALGAARVPRSALPAALLAAGTTIFAGSLYLMALTGLRTLGMVTPFGGVLLIAGWLVLAWRTARPRRP